MLAFIAVAALALLVQTIGMLVMVLMARKAIQNMRDEMEQYRSTILPLIVRVRDLVQHVAPRVESAAEELSAITTKLREQTAEVQLAATDIIARTQSQVGRVDHMVTAVFDRMERAGLFMSDAVSKPMRQLSGLIASVRAAVETLRGSDGHRPPASARSGYRYTETEAATPPPAGAATPIRPL